MQATDIHQIKATLRDQAFVGCIQVRCLIGRVVAIRRRKGQLQTMIYGWGRWYPVESVTIEIQSTTRRSRWRKSHRAYN